MMSAQALPITRREFAYFFFVASLIVATVMMLGAFVWAATPPPHIHCDLYLSGYVDCHPLK
jgi:hypothetical protein